MRERHADLIATVLEAEDVFDVAERAQCRCSIGQCIDHRAGVGGRQLRERGVVAAGEADYLAPAATWGDQVLETGWRVYWLPLCRKGRETVLEYDDGQSGQAAAGGRYVRACR
jgi:hypothetical protein